VTSTRTRLALAAMSACVTATALYAVVRGVQWVLVREPNPATVIWSAHAGYFWRMLTVVYAGGMAGMLGWLEAGRDPVRMARALAVGVVIAGLLLAAQGVLLP
jgi:hypothetical protein